MSNHLNLKILIHIFTIIFLITIIIIMRGENFVAHRCAAEHRLRITDLEQAVTALHYFSLPVVKNYVLYEKRQ
jgi:hypothetical protein